MGIEGTFSHGRIIPKGAPYDSKTNRGINTNNSRVTRLFVNCFGKGTIKTKVDNKTVYLNKGSSFKYLHQKSAKDLPDEFKKFKKQTSTDILADIQAKFNELNSVKEKIPKSVESTHSVLEVKKIPEKTELTPFEALEETIRLATYELNKQNTKEGDKAYPLLGAFKIMNYPQIQQERKSSYAENYFINKPDSAFLVCNFDPGCFFQGGTSNGAPDFKMGFLHHELKNKGIDHHWYWMNDQEAVLYLPLDKENQDTTLNQLNQTFQKPFIVSFLEQFENQSKATLDFWGLSDWNKPIEFTKLDSPEGSLHFTISDPDYAKPLILAIEQQWPKAEVKWNEKNKTVEVSHFSLETHLTHEMYKAHHKIKDPPPPEDS